MRFKLLNGQSVYKNIEHTRIDWDGKSLSKVQYNVKQFLRLYWERQVVYEEMPIPGTRLHCDIVNFSRKIAVEPGGAFHWQYNKHIHSNSRSKYLKSLGNDNKKREFMELNGFKFIEIHEKEVPLLTHEYFEKNFGVRL